MERRIIGEICAKDIWTFAFKCLGRILFPIFLLMPVIVVWRIFFYNPEDFWRIVRLGLIYVIAVTVWVWLTSYKTVFEIDGEYLYLIKKRCFLFGIGKKQILLNEIKQITIAEVKIIKREPTKFEKVFRLKLMYNLMYKLGTLLLNKGKMNICILYGEPAETVVIDDIKKNDERYLYLMELHEKLKGEKS